MTRNFALIALALTCFAPLRAQADFEAAVALYKARRYPEARAALENVVAREPKNAAACHYLGLTWKLRNDDAALEEALKWLARGVELEPGNATYLADFGGTSLQLAARTRSVSAATKGRDAMEKSLTMNPDNVDAREGLYQFYTQAPWPIGSSAKAAAHLAEIQKRAPDRATVLQVLAKANAKEYAAAFQLCDAVLAKTPDNYTALYQYGRTAAVSGQNLERGLANLQKCLTFDPPGPSSPSHSNVWQRIGNIQEQLKHPAEARAAYETALKLDPGNRQATDALGKLK
ncbi:MAG TPA: tetratricopeptide repeat protein [Opitutaceae bacterium]|nr:tetratricopeptide repeat protein [Opitutaceae bacterium]